MDFKIADIKKGITVIQSNIKLPRDTTDDLAQLLHTGAPRSWRNQAPWLSSSAEVALYVTLMVGMEKLKKIRRQTELRCFKGRNYYCWWNHERREKNGIVKRGKQVANEDVDM
ncbi:hypothetical protein MC885_003831, partial [Smutsia gigantea]